MSFTARTTEPGKDQWTRPAAVNPRAPRNPSLPKARAVVANGRSLQRILDGAMAALSRRGATQLSMSEVCEAAGVSRATLYRYFARKEDLLAAVGEHVSRNFADGIKRAVAASQSPAERLRLVLEFFIRYTAEVKSDRMLEIEPAFVLKFLQSHFPEHVAILNQALAPVYDDIEAHLGIRVNRMLLSEVLVRAEQSTVVVPSGRSWETLPEALSRMLEQLYRARRGNGKKAPGNARKAK
jgi:AcrR family transcriptional regulator